MAYSCVKITLEIGHQASIRNKSTPEGFTHDWEVFVRGSDNTNISHYVERVVFNLHHTFSEPKRVVKEPPYSVKESGYAGFTLPIEVYFKGHDKPRKLAFNYDLFLPSKGPPIKKVITEKYIFKNPSEELRRKLIRGGGVGVVGSDLTGNSSLSEGSALTTMAKQTPTNALAAQNNMVPTVAKPKLSIEINKKTPKPKVEVNQGTNNFSDLFGPPIKKVSPDSKKPSSSPKVPPSPKGKNEKTSSSDRSSEKVKYSKHHHKEKDKEKDDGDRNTIREKERSKDKEKKEKSVKRSSSPPKPRPLSPKRAPSPKRPLTPPIKRAPSPKHSPNKRPPTPTKHILKQEKDEIKRISDENKFKDSKSEQKIDKDKKKKERRNKDEKSTREKHKDKEKDHDKIPKTEKKELKEEKKIKEKEPPKEEKIKEKISTERDKSRHKHKKKRHEEEKKEKHDKDKIKKEFKNDKDKNGVNIDTSLKSTLVSSPILTPMEIEKQNRNPLKKLYDEMDPSSSDSNQSIYLEENDIHVKNVKPKVEDIIEKVIHKPETSERNNNNSKIKKDKVSSKKKEKKEISKTKEGGSIKEEKDNRKRKRKTTTKTKEELSEKESKVIKLDTEDSKSETKIANKSYDTNLMETGSEDEEGEIASHDESVEEESVEDQKPEINENSPVTACNSELMSSFNHDYLTQLRELQQKIMTLDDSVELQRLVAVITETGLYEITNHTFDFDLCALDRNTVKRLQDFFAAS